MSNANRRLLPQVVTVLLIAASLKYFYSVASAEQLTWLLGPTAAGVELVTGTRFTYEAYSGYLNADRNFLIAPVCSGMNFLIAAFLLLSFVSLRRSPSRRAGWWSILTAISTAYLTTIIANTVRISLAVSAQGGHSGNSWFDREQMHRIEGIAVYFGFLLALFFISECLHKKRRSVGNGWGKALPGLLIPLMIYYAVTIVVPLVNGGFLQGREFREHALFVIVVPVLLIAPVAVFRWIAISRRNLKTG